MILKTASLVDHETVGPSCTLNDACIIFSMGNGEKWKWIDIRYLWLSVYGLDSSMMPVLFSVWDDEMEID